MSNFISTVLSIGEERFRKQQEKVLSFSKTGGSYEEWINWELFNAFEQAGYRAVPKPAYREYGEASSTNYKGDVYIQRDSSRCLIEVTLVGNWTKNKWLQKLERDRKKLLDLQSSHIDLVKLQMLVLAADYPDLIEEWGSWLSKLSFWNTKQINTKVFSSLEGEMVICAWQVVT